MSLRIRRVVHPFYIIKGFDLIRRSAIAFLPKRELGHQLVAACLGDQDGGKGGVILDLLP